MQLDQSYLQQYIASRCFVKPEIRLSNYLLKWDESSYGIPQTEVSELKAFLRDILPYISGAFFKAAGKISATIEEEIGDIKKARKIQESFSPKLLLSRSRGGDCTYILQMHQDGTAIIKRNEKVTIANAAAASNSKQIKIRAFQLDFLLGELVFIR